MDGKYTNKDAFLERSSQCLKIHPKMSHYFWYLQYIFYFWSIVKLVEKLRPSKMLAGQKMPESLWKFWWEGGIPFASRKTGMKGTTSARNCTQEGTERLMMWKERKRRMHYFRYEMKKGYLDSIQHIIKDGNDTC